MMTKRNDYRSLREQMVQSQLMQRRIRDGRTLDAMRRVPREAFVPEKVRGSAYDDRPLPIGENQTISQPYMVALMTEALELTGGETVLEIGTGSGYQTAVLAEIVKTVFSIERIGPLADSARALLQQLGYANVTVLVGDGTQGAAEHAPFDAIIVTAGSPGVPLSLKEQLADGGRLVIPVGSRGYQELNRIRRLGNDFITENLGGCVFVPLIGVQGWEWN